MLYKFSLTIPPETEADDLVSSKVTLSRGRITRVMIGFPDGCMGLTKVRVMFGLVQIYPLNPDSWISWNNYNLEFDDDLKLPDVSNTLTLQGYNEDDFFPHTIEFRFVIFVDDPLSLDATLPERQEIKILDVEES